jgi:hypothetical protein
LEATRKVVAFILGLTFKDGAVGLRPELMAAALCTSRARGLRRSGRAVAKAANDR